MNEENNVLEFPRPVNQVPNEQPPIALVGRGGPIMQLRGDDFAPVGAAIGKAGAIPHVEVIKVDVPLFVAKALQNQGNPGLEVVGEVQDGENADAANVTMG